MDREEASKALELLRKVVGQAKDDTALQNWGVIWMIHACTNAAGYLVTDELFRRGHLTPWPFAALWAGINITNLLLIFVLKRGQASGTRSFIENQIWIIWTSFVGGAILIAFCNLFLGLDRLFAGPAMSLLAAFAFMMMGGMMGRRWFISAATFALGALAMCFLPRWQFTIFGVLWFLFQFVGGAVLHREKQRRLAAGAPAPRLV